MRRALLAGGVALLLGGATLGLAFAQQTPTPAPTAPGQTAPARPGHQAFLDALARRLGITTERLQQAMTEARNEVGLPERGMKPGFGHGGRGHSFGRGGLDASAAAQAIGISVDQLRQELPGKSLAQVAQAHGKNPADVATALKSAANQRIDQAATAGRLTAEQATQLKQQTAQRIDQQINQVVPEGAKGFHGRGPKAPATPTSSS
ncbi:MAG: hypothetical protein HY690_19880 [Chloroflexi bacterium]|nr:hypothetical protein [Chloroflexota bacterium]